MFLTLLYRQVVGAAHIWRRLHNAFAMVTSNTRIITAFTFTTTTVLEIFEKITRRLDSINRDGIEVRHIDYETYVHRQMMRLLSDHVCKPLAGWARKGTC